MILRLVGKVQEVLKYGRRHRIVMSVAEMVDKFKSIFECCVPRAHTHNTRLGEQFVKSSEANVIT